MTLNDFQTFLKYHEFQAALSLLTGAIGMAWWRKDGPSGDEMTVEASNLILDNLSNADNVRKIDVLVGRNLRDQLTIEEAQDMHKERELRKFGWGRN